MAKVGSVVLKQQIMLLFVINWGTINFFIFYSFCREALLSVSKNFFEEVDLGAGDVKVMAI